MVLIYLLLTNPYTSPGSWRCQTVYYSHLLLHPTSSFITLSISLQRDCHPLGPNVTIYPAVLSQVFQDSPHLLVQDLGKGLKGIHLKEGEILHDIDDLLGGKVSVYNAGDPGSIPGLGRSPGEGNGYPLQYFCLENSVERSLVGYSPWGCKELDTTERLSVSFDSELNQSTIKIYSL